MIGKHSEHYTELTFLDAMRLWFQLWVFCGGFPVNDVTTPLVSLGRMSATWSYRNRAVFDKTSGTEQLYCLNSGKIFCVAIAVLRTDSIALDGTVLLTILSQTNTVDMTLPKYLRYVRILFF
jgi:hypothetical protein